VRGRIANAKSFGWAIYAAGFAIWLFGYLSAGHAPLFDWDAATPWWTNRKRPQSGRGWVIYEYSTISVAGAAQSIRASAQVTAPGAATNMIVAVSTRPNRQNRSTCSRMSVASVQKQKLYPYQSAGL
jgi:hypothetical protein